MDLSDLNPSSDSSYATLARSDGTSLYLTRDIAAAIDRYDRHKFDRMYYVVDKSQSNHFKQLIGVLKMMKYSWADRLVYCHGLSKQMVLPSHPIPVTMIMHTRDKHITTAATGTRTWVS